MNPPEGWSDWINEHKVCWEMLPYHAITSKGRTQVGFELDLFAQVRDANANPGCNTCQQIYKRLVGIALSCMPQEQRPSRHDIQVFDAAFHFRAETKLKPEIQLTVLIVHRTEFFQPVDDCEIRCAREIQQHLKELGIQRKVWSQKIGA